MANSLDKFRKGVAQWSGNIGSAGISDAVVKTVPLASTSGLPTDTAVMITVNRVDANGKKTGNYEGIVGVVSGSNLIDCIRGVEGTAQAWTGGTVVEVLHTASNINELIDGILAEHNQDGKHTSAVVTTLKATGAVVNTGTSDVTIVTPKAIADSKLVDYIRGDGWISANETWTYASATTITVPSGAASKYAKGDKIKLTQTTVKYFYIVGVADTVLTITGGSSYTLANAAITSPYYSYASTPQGFPAFMSYTPTWSNVTIGSATVVARFTMIGKLVWVKLSVVFASDSSISGTIGFSLPIPGDTDISDNIMIGTNYAEDAGIAGHCGFIRQSTITTAIPTLYSGSLYNATVPFTWGNGDFFKCVFTYEAA